MTDGAASASRRPRGRRNAFYFILLLLALPVLYLLYLRDLSFYEISGRSMQPALAPGERLFTLDAGEYRRGDIVAVRDPVERGTVDIKRVVAVGGDHVAIRNGALYLNGSYASEPYLPEFIDYDLPEYTVPGGHVFVLGDNRNWSVDSHNWGQPSGSHDATQPVPIALDDIVGRVRAVYLPWKRSRWIQPFPLRTVSEIEGTAPTPPDSPGANAGVQ